MSKAFYSRLLSTLILWVVIGGAIYWDIEPMFITIAALFGLGTTHEYLRLFRDDAQGRAHRWLGMGISIFYWGGVIFHVLIHHTEPPLWYDVAALVLVLQGAFILSYRHGLEGTETLYHIFSTVFGTLYTVVLFGFVARLMYFEGDVSTGLFLMLHLLMVTKFTDMGAYLVGSVFGKHKMIPHISPAKSWEGFVGAFLGGLLATAIMFYFFEARLAPLSLLRALGLVPLLSLAAVAGDLAESLLKRCVSIKDSGHSLPGIGGVLDLTDSILFTAPLFYFYLRALSGY